MIRQMMKGKKMRNERKENKIVDKKTVTQVIAVIIFLFILIVSLITLSSTVKVSNLAFLKYRYYIMRAESTPEIAEVGDLVIAKRVKIGEIKKGDSIVYSDGTYYYADEIVEMKNTGKVTKMVIAEKDGIQYQFSENEICGKVIKTIPDLGNIIEFIRTTLGTILYMIFVICIFVLLRYIFIHKKDEEQEQNMQNT